MLFRSTGSDPVAKLDYDESIYSDDRLRLLDVRGGAWLPSATVAWQPSDFCRCAVGAIA